MQFLEQNTLLGIIIGATIVFAKDIIVIRSMEKIEYLKLNTKEKVEAYRKLFEFSRDLYRFSFPDNPDVVNEFKEVYRKENRIIQMNYHYFNKKIIKILLKIESSYSCFIYDLNYIKDTEKDFKKNFPIIAKQLYDSVIEEFKKWGK